MSHQRSLSAILFAILGLVAGPAFAVCVIDADIAATPGEDPSQPAWTYEVNLTWSNATGVDHWMLLLDTEFGTCSCADFQAAPVPPQPGGGTRGQRRGVPGFEASALECAGDPRSNQTGFLITFTPTSGPACRRAQPIRSLYLPVGRRFRPWSARGGFPVANLDLQRCAGTLTGRFPPWPANLIGAEQQSWGTFRRLYR
ncbi:MAG: hypothetical protein IPP62_18630 [bacterium]|nr:hypothetical protein [bacterium]